LDWTLLDVVQAVAQELQGEDDWSL
jgi:hypothetical protein